MGLLDGLFGTSQGNTTVVNNSEPWKVAQPYITDVMSHGQGLFNQNFTSPYTTQAQTLTANRAINGSPLLNGAEGLLGNTIRGDYLDPYSNPYFGGALTDTLGRVKSAINANFGGDNFGSSAHQEWLNKGLSNAALPMLSNFYQQERGNQQNALGLAPSYAATDYTDLNALSNVGAQQENNPWKKLAQYQSAISGFGNLGGTQTQQQPYYVNNTANTLGTAANLGILAASLGFI